MPSMRVHAGSTWLAILLAVASQPSGDVTSSAGW